MITIEGKGLGRRRPLFEGFSIPPPPGDPGDGEPLTLRRLITHVVHMEVEAFRTRQQVRRLDRVLSNDAIERGLERGKVEVLKAAIRRSRLRKPSTRIRLWRRLSRRLSTGYILS